MRSNLSVINVYNKKNTKSKVITQLLYGDNFKKLEQSGSWIKIKNNSDNYKGYIKNKKFPSSHKSTHKICVLRSNLYSKPNVRNKILSKFYKNYSKSIPFIGKFIVGKSQPYEYLIDSIKKFHSQDEFLEMIRMQNFINVSYRSLSGGIGAIHSAWKV